MDGIIRSLDIRREFVEITSWERDNPNWQYKCECGELLTLDNPPRGKFVKREYYRDGEYSNISSYHCKKCWRRVPDSIIANMVIPNNQREFIAPYDKQKITVEIVFDTIPQSIIGEHRIFKVKISDGIVYKIEGLINSFNFTASVTGEVIGNFDIYGKISRIK